MLTSKSASQLATRYASKRGTSKKGKVKTDPMAPGVRAGAGMKSKGRGRNMSPGVPRGSYSDVARSR